MCPTKIKIGRGISFQPVIIAALTTGWKAIPPRVTRSVHFAAPVGTSLLPLFRGPSSLSLPAAGILDKYFLEMWKNLFMSLVTRAPSAGLEVAVLG